MLTEKDYPNKAIEATPGDRIARAKSRPAWYECPTKHVSMLPCVTCGATPPRPDLLRQFAEGPDDAGAWEPWYGRSVITPAPVDPPSPEFIEKNAELVAVYQATTRRRDSLTAQILRRQRETFPRMRLDAETGQVLRDDQVVDEHGQVVLRSGALARRGTMNREIDDLLEQRDDAERAQVAALRALNDHARGPRDQVTKPRRPRLVGMLLGGAR